jgi:hypothetical protein
MRRVSVLLVALTLCSAPLTSRAVTLPLGVDSHTFFPNLFSVFTGGVTASDGSVPIAHTPPLTSITIPATGGSLTYDYINGGSQAEVRFSVSLLSDADPFVQTGTWGPSAIPVTLRIDELTYESPASGDPSIVVAAGGGTFGGAMLNLSSTATLRGSLTIGSLTTPFTETATGCCASRDAIPNPPALDLNGFFPLNPYDVVVGFGGGPGLAAQFGVTLPAMDVATVDGVTFTVGNIGTTFYTLTYLPEPGPAALLAVAGASLALLRRRRTVEPRLGGSADPALVDLLPVH